MQTHNKIKARAQDIEVENAQFQQFVSTLKEQRPNKPNKVEQADHDHSLASHPIRSEHESSPVSKELLSQGSRSLYMQSNRTSDHVSFNFGGDQALRNRGRLGVANRYTVKQYQLPSQYFTPTKLKLQQYLKDSRILPNADSAVSPKTVLSAQRGVQSQIEILPLDESKVVRGQGKGLKIYELNAQLALKYCIAFQLSERSDTNEILRFFTKLLEMLDFTMAAPKIEKYKDCIYFGKGTKRRQNGEGFLYFYARSIYFGELYEYFMHGRGTQVFWDAPAIYKGDFKEGTMHGHFEVTKQDQRYSGFIQNGVYHGYGKLQTREGTIEGEFREGRFMGNSRSMPKQSYQKQQSSFRIRGNSHQKQAPYDQYQSSHYKNRSFNDQHYQRQYEVDPWSHPPKTSRVKKSKPHSLFSDMMQFSYPFGNQFVEQEPKQYRVHRNTNQSFHNPQMSGNRNRFSLQKENLRQMGYYNRVRPIREETDFGQQQPLELKC